VLIIGVKLFLLSNCDLCFSGRLSKEEIERMVKDAERYKQEDESQKDRIQAKNALESYAFNMKSTVEDEKLKDKISDADKKVITDKCNEIIAWLDANQVSTVIILQVVRSVEIHNFL